MYNTQINLKSFSAYAIRWDIHKGCLADPPRLCLENTDFGQPWTDGRGGQIYSFWLDVPF